jgi:hypothetical protein
MFHLNVCLTSERWINLFYNLYFLELLVGFLEKNTFRIPHDL